MSLETKTVTIKDFTFGDGTPRICVPLIGRTGEEIFAMSKIIRMEIDRLDALYANRPDLRIAVIEWRADYYGNIAETANVFNILRHLRTLFPDRLILFTFRSEEQGGEIRNDRVHMGMEDIMRNVVSSGMVDMVDVEAVVGNYNIARATTRLHAGNVKVVLSYHDFQDTPHDAEIEEKLRFLDEEYLSKVEPQEAVKEPKITVKKQDKPFYCTYTADGDSWKRMWQCADIRYYRRLC